MFKILQLLRKLFLQLSEIC